MPTTQKSPDIEIYVQSTDTSAVQAWLGQRFPQKTPLAWRPAGKRQWRSKLDHDGHTIPVLVIEEASHGFISIWLDSPHTPWVDDKECAREVFVALGCPVRATAGSWHEGDDPDLWWEFNQTGEHELHWPG